MDQLNDKQRQIVRLAYTTKDPELRRKAVENVLKAQHIVEARYTPEFKAWADAQGDVFTNPKTQNKNRFNSIPSEAQREVYRRWKAGDYHEQGGPAPGAGGEGGGAGKEKAAPADEGGDEGGPRGQKHKGRTQLRGVAKKQMEDPAELGDRDLGDFLPVTKLTRLPAERGRRLREGLKKATFNELEALEKITQFIVENPDDEYSKKHWMTESLGLTPAEIKTFHKGVRKKLADARGRLYGERVLEIANNNDLEGLDADAVHQFRLDKPKWGRQLTPEQLKQKFLQGPWADAETKERVRDMTADEFMAMRNAIFDEEEEEEMGASAKVASVIGDEDFNMFELPPGMGKGARLSEVGRKIVRIAYESKDPAVREKITKLVAQQRQSVSS